MSSLRLTIYSLGFSLILTGSSSMLGLLETIGNSTKKVVNLPKNGNQTMGEQDIVSFMETSRKTCKPKEEARRPKITAAHNQGKR